MAGKKKSGTRMKPQYVRNKKRKGADSSARARRALSIVLLLLVIGGIVYGIKEGFEWIGRKLYSENPRFEIQHLEVSCDGKLSEDRIREYTGLAEGMNLFAVKFREVEMDLEKVAMVESVYLERKLPHTLIVKVKERMPVARIIGKQSRRFPFVVDRYGVVLPPRQSASTLPLVKGLDLDLRMGMPINHPDIKTALQIIALCDSTGNWRQHIQIASLDVQHQDYIDMRLKSGTRVKMPRYSIMNNLRTLSATIQTGHTRGESYRDIDLTLDSPKVPVVPF
jgi:cell division septal protein FtsQ